MSNETTQPEVKPASKRNITIDRLRGLIVFAMIFFICAAEFPCLGILSRIANNGENHIMLFKGMSLADIADPIFVFLISVSYQISFSHRYERDGDKAFKHFLVRYLCFSGFGSIMTSIEDLVRGCDNHVMAEYVLMFAAAAFGIAILVLRLIKKAPKKYSEWAKFAAVGCLMVLGCFGIVKGICDAVFLFGKFDIPKFRHWSILHELGVTGLWLLPFMKMKTNHKIIAWSALVTVYTVVQNIPGMLDVFSFEVLGGFIGTFGWLILMLGGVIFSELYNSEKKAPLFIAMGVLFVLTVLTCIFLPLKVRGVTTNYVLFTLCVVETLFCVFSLFRNWNPKVKFLVWWGRNPFPLFLIGLVFRLAQKVWNPSADTPMAIALLATFGSVTLLSVIAYILYKKDIIIKM